MLYPCWVKLHEATWQTADTFSRDGVVVIPTGSLEQHGPALPLFTDSLIVTAVAERIESKLQDRVLLTPTLWLGASAHHLGFCGTLSASFSAYQLAIESFVESLLGFGFHKFYLLNGHGGNTEPNAIVLRHLKQSHPEVTFAHRAYYDFAQSCISETLTGPLKQMRHACEAEASLMLHLHPGLVQIELLRDDGLAPSPPISGLVHHFDEITEQGSFGFATLANAEKGEKIFDAACSGLVSDLSALANGYVLRGL